jgi:5'-3' exonuclease
MRAITPAPRSCTIYGLDADLILLAMLLGVDTGASVQLLREAQEFESAASAGEWRSFSVTELVHALLPHDHSSSRIRDFVAGMSLLGNDFLPRSLTKTVRDDGIPTLIHTLDRCLWSRGLSLIAADGYLNRAALLAIVEDWAATEPTDLLVAAKDARRAATRPAGIGDTPADTAVREWSAQPARWATLTRLLAPAARPAAIYASWHPGTPANYCAGLAWVWDYYMGRAVDQGWVFDEHLPPLWSDVAAWLRGSTSPSIAPPPVEYPTPLPEWLHLLAVLPMESVHRLLPADKHTLAITHPWYWPTGWSVFGVGRTQLWECEPVIPLIPERLLRSAAAATAAAAKK